MAIVKIKTGGRPITIDTEETILNFQRNILKAKKTLASIRRRTSGYREERLLGTPTTLPDFITNTLDALNALQDGEKLSLQAVREIKSNIKATRELASVQSRVRERALADLMRQQYEAEMLNVAKDASKFTKKSVGRQIGRIRAMTKKQQQEFFTSTKYQSPKTMYKRYKKIVDWANADYKKRSGQDVNLSWQEAYTYMLERRQADGLTI